jgi:uncharacterized membrane protein
MPFCLARLESRRSGTLEVKLRIAASNVVLQEHRENRDESHGEWMIRSFACARLQARCLRIQALELLWISNARELIAGLMGVLCPYGSIYLILTI